MVFTVLICDDELLERQVVSLIIKDSNLPLKVVGEAKNGFEAVEQSRKLKPDIVFMDIKMPGKDGLTAAAEIKKFHPDSKTVFVTAYDEFEYAKKALKVGAAEFLLKPVRPDEITVLLKRIIKVLNKEREKKLKEEELLNSIKEAESTLKSGIMASMLMGNIEDEEVLKSQAKLLGIEKLPSSIIVVLPDVNKDSPNAELYRYEVFRYIQKMFSKDENVFLFLMSEEVVLGVPSCSSPLLIADNIRKKIKENLDITVTVGVGQGENMDINVLFQEAQLAAKLGKFFVGSNKVINNDILSDFLGDISEYRIDKENTLLKYVKMGDYEKVLELMEEIFDDISDFGKGSLLFCQVRISELMVMICRTARQVGLVEPQDAHFYSAHLKKLGRCKTYAALKLCFKAFLEDVFLKKNKLSSEELILQAMQYIEDNYNKDLKLWKLAKKAYISPDYFSRLFKKVAGCTYAEYITKVRIENAKILLKNPAISVAEVAKRIGYSNPNYFSRVFKKMVGAPPSEYKTL